MVMSSVGFAVYHSDTVQILLWPGSLNYLTAAYKVNNSYIPAVRAILSLSVERETCHCLLLSPLDEARDMAAHVLLAMGPVILLEAEYFYFCFT